MPRQARVAPGGLVYHVLNRGVGRMTLFEKDGDFLAFERCLREAQEVVAVPLLSYCVMPNHWHLVLAPEKDGHLATFMQRLTLTHARRWQEHRKLHGCGHVYQGRYKSFPVQCDEHFLSLARYVERNALRANLTARAERWRWCSLWRRRNRLVDPELPTLSRWPVPEPAHWLRLVNTPQTQGDVDALRKSMERGQPFGGERWVRQMTTRLGLEHTFRPRGRPRSSKATPSP